MVSCCCHGNPAISAQAGLNRKGCTVVCQPMIMPLPRNAICATIFAPLLFSSRMVEICSASGISCAIDCNAAKVTGNPVSRLNSPIHWNSFQSRFRSLAISNTPCPTRPIARPIPSSSSCVAVVPGTSSPSTDLCNTVLEVEKPNAPALRPSSTMADISAISESVGASLVAPRSPITYARTAPCGTCVPTSTVRGSFSRASRYSGKLSQSQDIPSASAVPGISSTPSIRPISHWCLSGFAGAKPTPQLPITTVVTPCHEEGAISASQVAWPS